eukprot:scaffold87386_cov63-Phaeocystis_antarctica.AAC.2
MYESRTSSAASFERERVNKDGENDNCGEHVVQIKPVAFFWHSLLFFSMGDLLLLAITCVCRLHWSARRGSWSRVIRWGVDFIPMKFLWRTELPFARGRGHVWRGGFCVISCLLDNQQHLRPFSNTGMHATYTQRSMKRAVVSVFTVVRRTRRLYQSFRLACASVPMCRTSQMMFNYHMITSRPARPTAAFAAALAGMWPSSSVSSAGSAPLSSAAARAAQPASVIWVPLRLSCLSFASPPVGGGGAPAGGGSARRAMESLQRGQPPQGRREGHQPRVADLGGATQREALEPRQGAPAQGGGER